MKAIIGIIAVLVIIGGALVLGGKPNNGQAAVKIAAPASANDTANQTSAANVITYTNSGFAPASLSVQSGSKITIKNSSSNPLQFDSNPHPEHTDDPELNVGLVGTGQSVTITVTAKGSHGYHNHLVASDTGTLVVE